MREGNVPQVMVAGTLGGGRVGQGAEGELCGVNRVVGMKRRAG